MERLFRNDDDAADGDGGASDGSGSDDGDYGAGKLAPARQRHFMIDPADYTPLRVSANEDEARGRWFRSFWHTPALATLPALFATKLGPNDIQSLIDHLYLRRDYAAALHACRAFLALIAAARPHRRIHAHEAHETAARCALRLGQFADAREHADAALADRPDLPGVVALAADARARAGDCGGALRLWRKYLGARPNDYRAWMEIADALARAAERVGAAGAEDAEAHAGEGGVAAKDRPDDTAAAAAAARRCRTWALLALRRAAAIRARSPRPLSVFARRNDDTEGVALARAARDLEDLLGIESPGEAVVAPPSVDEAAGGGGCRAAGVDDEAVSWLRAELVDAGAGEGEVEADEEDKVWS
ncbi:hypothetical protein DFJ73DRAFT_949307 [Zopfochytrium polystomum]|nr:hypothetical protein DFJ73DRAFT_949307 [Zopfochytrium polystomum]